MEEQAAEAVNWIVEFWIPVVLLGLGVASGLYTYRLQKHYDRASYRREKDIDRSEDIRKEKRTAFVAFVSGLDGMINHHVTDDHEKQAEMILGAKAAFNELSLRTTAENFTRFSQLLDAAVLLARCHVRLEGIEIADADEDAAKQAYNRALVRAVNAARAEFGLQGDTVSEGSVGAFLLPAKARGEAPKVPTA